MDQREKLLRAFDLGQEDLEANRKGLLGERQARQIIRSGYWDLLSAVVIGVGLAAILYWVATKPLVPVQWILSGVLAAAAMMVGVVYYRRCRAAVADGRVECLTGPVRTRMQRRAGWFLDVAGRSFRLPIRFWHVKNDQPYRVYVASRVNRVVAMEPEGWG